MSSLIKRLTREVFRHDSNPWSAWTRLLSVPLVFVPIWTRSWKHAILIHGWLIANAIAFPEPKNDRAWATRAMLGEEMWIAKRPLDRAMALSIGATALGLGGVLGAYKQRLLPTAVCTVGAGGAALGVLARDGSLLRTPPRRTCMTFRAGANFAERGFSEVGVQRGGQGTPGGKEPRNVALPLSHAN